METYGNRFVLHGASNGKRKECLLQTQYKERKPCQTIADITEHH